MSLQVIKDAAMVCAVLGVLTSPANAQSEAVRLISNDGRVDISGTYVSFVDGNYVIMTELGEMRASADSVQCVGDPCPSFASPEADVIVGGSDTVGLGLMPLLLGGYGSSKGAEVTIAPTTNQNEVLAKVVADGGFGDDLSSLLVASTTSGNGFDLLEERAIELSMASRRIRPAEARALRDSGAGNMVSPSQEHIIAVDSLVIITNPENTITSLSTDQVAQIYAGLITNWSEVGGDNMPITVVTLPEGSGTRSVFESRIFGDGNLSISGSATVVATNPDASQFISSNKGAIAYVSWAFQRDANPLTLVNSCGISIAPDAFSARTEEYALQRRLYVYTREDTLSSKGRDFVSYLTSEDADDAITKAGFIGFAVDRRDQPLDGSRARSLLDPGVDEYEGSFMRQMLAQMVDFDRLSTTFRFRTGSARLDERGEIDKLRLINYLRSQPDGTEVVFVGFTDDVGQFAGNLDLSQRRAALVASEMINAVGNTLPNVSMTSVGYGEISPAGCNSEEEGRRINRRVEVWIKTPV